MMGVFQLVKPINKSTYKLILKIMLRRFERMQSYGSYITHCIAHHTHVVIYANLTAYNTIIYANLTAYNTITPLIARGAAECKLMQ